MSAAGEGGVPPEIDMSVPSVARMYDYAIGGKDNFEVDRAAAHELAKVFPEGFQFTRDNRSFLGRAVHYLTKEAGIRQFIDNGSGLPAQRTVHQVAQELNPDARVVYIDNDPVVLAYGRALLEGNGKTTVLQADLAEPEKILAEESTRKLIDRNEPVAALYVSVLHCLPDEGKPGDVVTRMLDALPSGSYVVISHLVAEDQAPMDYFTEYMNRSMSWGRVRRPAEVTRFFDGLEILEPGLVDIEFWRPDSYTEEMTFDLPFDVPVVAPGDKQLWEFGGVARKP
ncbi:SAM-dependent methyltransferase [Saccharopolyspora sp. 5N708]|uniref:SAM-dependent methyltransferase n=1 Tax=Saccharopolyspora sp. 5N708 TaxID=3457424 RepID=UPI003FD33BD5